MLPDDLVAMLDGQLAEARAAAARAVDRCDALRDLRSLALAALHAGRLPHSPADLVLDPDDEDTRARVAALVARIEGATS